ncbi:hypothetical protein J4050_01400 [Winogradskyella sp. DF17]|jgi:hypothetical protein|uniref:Uncharacterized protein n=1 Tax=Winogradskyella pelagia TaxID=2819984 RepID=A0ABS3SY17_9FLAO|nr:hypothetical protein [Winogradskyella sp. DF17]MBO3115381.1 hypothetical protein [Winogradskyella sp. DF17]
MKPLQFLRKRLLREHADRWQQQATVANSKSKTPAKQKHQEEEDAFLFI